MKKALKLALASFFLSHAGLTDGRAQGYAVDAQISNQAVGDGTYNYTITLKDKAASGQSIGMFWFAWFTYSYYGYSYDYDLLASPPTITQTPPGWYAYVVNNSDYDGYSIEFYNYYGSDLTPGNSFTFGFNSADSPDTLNQQSPYYPVPTMTSFVYNDYTMSDPGYEFVVTSPPAAPSVKSVGILGGGSFRFSFTNAPGYTFTVLGSTNLFLAVTNWPVVGQVTEAPPGSGSYQFTDPGAGTNQPQRFYTLRWP